MTRSKSLTLSCSNEQFKAYVQAKMNNTLDNTTWSQMTPALRCKISKYANKLKFKKEDKANEA